MFWANLIHSKYQWSLIVMKEIITSILFLLGGGLLLTPFIGFLIKSNKNNKSA